MARVGNNRDGLGARRLAFIALVAVMFASRAGLGQDGGVKPGGAEGQGVADLATRFHLVERYGVPEKGGEVIGPYRVAIRETLGLSDERAQGAPDRREVTTQVIFGERPARVGPTGGVLATVRKYEAFRRSPDPTTVPGGSRPLEGLTVWYQAVPGGDPQVLSLTEGRGLTESDYIEVSRQVFLPDLAAVFPSLAIRIGDRWSLSKGAVRALLGVTPGRGEPITCVLQEVRQAPKGTDWEAVIGIKGRTSLSIGETSVNARLVFAFAKPGGGDSAPARGGSDEGVVEARGAIRELRMAMSTSSLRPGGNGRLRQVSTRELILERQRGAAATMPAIPEPPPTPTEANSWLTYDDPARKFHLRHPQDFHQGPITGADVVELLRPGKAGGPDRVEIQLQPKTGDPQADRANRNPEFHVKTLTEVWREQKQDVLRGPNGWLPEADWAPLKMKVYRINAALRASGPSARSESRIHYDAYLVLFGRDESLFVQATTLQDPPTPFRKQVEAILKTFRFGPSGAR